MKIDPQSVEVGLGAVAVIAGCLGLWRRKPARIFALSLAVFLVFELLYFATALDFLIPVWWLVHLPSALMLGADEILERHGAMVSTVFHLGDFFLWSAVVTGVVWLRDQRRKHKALFTSSGR